MNPTTYRIHSSGAYVNPQPAALPENYGDLVAWRYLPSEGRAARARLAQGELDVLERCRTALGWRTITSLATKWYPLYPSRKAWDRALSHCRTFAGTGRLRTKTLNLVYLLKAVITHFSEQLRAAYARIRIPSPYKDLSNHRTYSNTASEDQNTAGTTRPGRIDPAKYYRQRFAHLVVR